MPTGTCALCLQTKDLQDSHLLPKAFYKSARSAGEKNPNPIIKNMRKIQFVIPGVTFQRAKAMPKNIRAL